MSIYAIADLHLSLAPGIEKPMDIYGPRWYDHVQRLRDNWIKLVQKEDTVIIPGDISWGLKLEEAKYDLDWIDSLPGKKVITKGNHDLWWGGITKLNKMYDSITFLQNDFYFVEDIYICGTRGWITPDNDEFSVEQDEKIYKREVLRLRASLEMAMNHFKKTSENMTEETDQMPNILGVLHYPPVSKTSSFSGFQQAFEDYNVKNVIYGHIHGEDGFKNTIRGNYHGTDYRLVSLDYLNCRPLCIKE